uniref:Uncharacterized protein n=1 Tax=Melanopsichium pennsylvanicum 4 TaxID=1398559 RepID=A0A077QXE5_9BASI|nr:putative protein [Melanopsichium pennsylvanicum 4]
MPLLLNTTGTMDAADVTGQYGTDATCCDNCCRFNCCWKSGALPVEDYPIANSAPANRTHTVDGAANTNQEGEQLPAYNAMPQMSAGASAMEAKRVEQPSTLS